MPEGSSSAAPVIKPGPRTEKKRRKRLGFSLAVGFAVMRRLCGLSESDGRGSIARAGSVVDLFSQLRQTSRAGMAFDPRWRPRTQLREPGGQR